MAVFEGMDDPIKRKVVTKRGEGSVEMGWIFQAGSATFAMGGLFSTDGTELGR